MSSGATRTPSKRSLPSWLSSSPPASRCAQAALLVCSLCMKLWSFASIVPRRTTNVCRSHLDARTQFHQQRFQHPRAMPVVESANLVDPISCALVCLKREGGVYCPLQHSTRQSLPHLPRLISACAFAMTHVTIVTCRCLLSQPALTCSTSFPCHIPTRISSHPAQACVTWSPRQALIAPASCQEH